MKTWQIALIISTIYIAPTLDKETSLIISGAWGLAMVYLLLSERRK